MNLTVKNFIISIVLCSLLSCDTFRERRTIKIKGSETLQPLMTKLAEKYNQNQQVEIIFKIEGGGSQSGINALLSDEVHIAMSSKPMTEADKDSSLAKGKQIKRLGIALDEILIIVNGKNKINHISSEQLRKIYSGEIATWNTLGGKKDSIIPLSRKQGSGSLSYFKDKIMEQKPFSASVVEMGSVKEILAKIEADSNAIGFVGGGHYSDKIKILEVSSNGKEYFAPTEINVRAKYYPFVVPLSLYYVENSEKEAVNKFLKFLESKTARYTITDMGFIPESSK